MRTKIFIIQNNGLSFQLDKSTYTAKIIDSPNVDSDIIISRSIIHLSHEYTITTIGNESFKNNKKIKTIYFTKDSKLQKIEKNAFFNSSIETISIPSSINELEEGWCNHTWYLTNLLISEDNPNLSYLDEEHRMIIGNSDKNKEKFDTLIFACRSIIHAKIPSTIKHISSHAFSECSNLDRIELTEDSKLQTIGKEAFARSSLKAFSITSNLIELGEGWCSYTHFLNRICISEKNKNFSFLDESQKILLGKTKAKKKSFNVLLFACRDIKEVIIPSSIKHISSFAFCGCRYLESIQFYKDSKLRTIGKEAFSCSLIESILIPPKVKCIHERTFFGCDNLISVCFSDESELLTIEKDAFYNSSIECISIPSCTEALKDGWSNGVQKLTKISISKNNKNYKFIDDEEKLIVGKSKFSKNYFDVIVFACRDITHVFIPSSIKYIRSFAFYKCCNIESIEFSDDSKLQIIGEEAFSFSSIKQISIPPKVTQIGKHAFSFCRNLKTIQFSEESEILSFKKDAFLSSSIESISIPKKLNELCDGWCFKTPQLVNVSISDKNQFFTFLDEEHQMIAGKSDNVLYFACRNIRNAFIPSTIKQISSYAFADCSKLNDFRISEDSELLRISENSFSFSSIQSISIPKSVTQIGKSAFSYCKTLETVQFPDDSKLSVFEKDLFCRSSIKNLSISANVDELKEGWCSCTPNLTNVTISQRNSRFAFLDEERKIVVGKSEKNQDFFDLLEFACRDVESVKVPSNIKKISSFAFSECCNLKDVEFSNDSQLISMGNDAFSFSQIDRILIPKNVEKVCLNCFQGCQKLKSIEFLGDHLIIDHLCFSKCSNLFLASFPNANTLFICSDSFLFTPKNLSLFVCVGVEII